MTRSRFNELLELRIKRIREVLQQKSNEYSTVADVFHNFKRSAELVNESALIRSTPQRECLAYMRKHIVSIFDLVEKFHDNKIDRNTPNMVVEKFGDAINYLIILEAMMFEQMFDEMCPV